MLTGKARIGQILGSSRAAHGHTQVGPAHSLQRPPSLPQLLLHRSWHGRRKHDVTRAGRRAGQSGHIGFIEWVQQAVQFGPGIGRVQRIAVGRRGHRETIGHPHTQRRQFPKHLAQRRIFATHQRQIGQREFPEPADVTGSGH